MPNLAGFLYDSAGAAINAATINIYTRNTTTPVIATTTTNASGYWQTASVAEGRYDVEIVNGTTTLRMKYDDQIQIEELEAAVFRLRNPADTFVYDIVPGAITAARTLNLPVITATDTIVVTTLAQTLASKTLSAPTITASDFANMTHTHASAATGGAIAIGVTREGGNTTEATTTSTSAVDLLTATALTIAAAEPFIAVGAGRKTAVASAGAIGLKLNTTTIAEASASDDTVWVSTTTNQAESGPFDFIVAPRVTNYVTPAVGRRVAYIAAGGASGSAVTSNLNRTAATAPTAQITDVVLRALIASGTVGTDEFHVYTMATS